VVTQSEKLVQKRPALPPRGTIAPRRPAIVWWAAVGAAAVAVQAFVFVTWFLSGEAKTTPTGADPVPTSTKFWAISIQSISILLFLGTAVLVVRQCRRRRVLTFDAVLVIAWCLSWWQDPILNYLRPIFFYNAYLVNLGSWTSRIPGWQSPDGHLLAEPLFAASIYGWMLLTSMLTCAGMRWAKRHWPQIGVPGLVLSALATMFIFDLLVEGLFVRTRLYSYAATVHDLSLWGDKPYHFPLYEPVLWGSVWATVGMLRYFRDDKGRSMVEKGVDTMVASTRKKNVFRVLAVTGFINVVFVVLYNIPIQFFSLNVDKMPAHPTYLRSGLCGDDTAYPCPGPDVPVYLRGQPGPQSPTTTGR
jgi:hypothetical protein